MDLYSHIYNADNESAQRIAKATIDYPLSLYRIAEIVELIGPVARAMGGAEDAINWLKNYLMKDDLLPY